MVLLKGFLRKNKTKKYIKILSTILTVIILLSSIKTYMNNEMNILKNSQTSLIVFTRESHEDYFQNSSDIVGYCRALSLSTGDDNEIIYTPNLVEDTYGNIYIENIDYTKLNWRSLEFDSENYPYILTLPASDSTENIYLNSNEVYLVLEKDVDYRSQYESNYKSKTITFKNKNKNKDISLEIKDFKNTESFRHIYISNDLYKELIKQEENYTYIITLEETVNLEQFINKIEHLEENDYYNVMLLTKKDNTDTTNKIESLEQMSKMIKIANVLSVIIFAIIAILIIKDITLEEKEENRFLGQVGYNKNQIFFITFKNLLALDFILIILSYILSVILILVINSIFPLFLPLPVITYILFVFTLFSLVELMFILL